MTNFDSNGFVAVGQPETDFPLLNQADFLAQANGDDPTGFAPTYGLLAEGFGNNPRFKIGARCQGWFYGVHGRGGDGIDAIPGQTVWPPDVGGTNAKDGPEVNDYSNFAGVMGTGVFVTGVAGTSINNVGVYGQSEEDPESAIPTTISAGIFGAANTGSGVVGWSTNWNGVEGWAYQGTAVLGVSVYDRGVHGASTWQPGVQGWSENDTGVMGGSGPEDTQGPSVPNTANIAGVLGTSDKQHGVIGTSNAGAGAIGFSSNSIGVIGTTANPASWAGAFVGNLLVTGAISAGTKDAIVPFPDGSKRVLHCMESPEHWFEDFGAAKLKRGRAVVKLDADFAKVIKRGDYRVFPAPEGDCRGLYVRRKSAASFEVRELMGGKSSIAFSYRIVGRRKDVKGHRRFAKIDTHLPLIAVAARAPRKAPRTRRGLRAFTARAEKEARARRPKGAEAVRSAFIARAEKEARARPPIRPQLQLPRAEKK